MTRRPFSVAPAALIVAGALLLNACSAGRTTQAIPNAPSASSIGTAQSLNSQSVAIQSTAFSTKLVWSHYQKLRTTTTPAATVNSPFDLTYFGGLYLQHAVSYPVYVNAPASTFGTPGRGTPSTFLARFAQSNFAHITDQYVHRTGSDRYTVGPDTQLNAPLPHAATLANLFALLHAAAITRGSGQGRIFHVFFKPGQDFCLGPGVCYSPDNPSTFVFCATHVAVLFNDVGLVLATVIPFQDVPGCTLPGATPHGAIDAEASGLSHELMETITDPEGDAWFNELFLTEIGDVCIGFFSNVNFNGLYYTVQPEYSNAAHGCVNGV